MACWMPAVMREGQSRVAGEAGRRGKEMYDVPREEEDMEWQHGRRGCGRDSGVVAGLSGSGAVFKAQFPQQQFQ